MRPATVGLSNKHVGQAVNPDRMGTGSICHSELNSESLTQWKITLHVPFPISFHHYHIDTYQSQTIPLKVVTNASNFFDWEPKTIP